MRKSEEQNPILGVLTTAAQAIGSTLGKIAVKTGLATPAPSAAKQPATPRKKTVKAASPVKRKAVRMSASKATARGSKKGK